MDKLDNLYTILEEQLHLYEEFVKVEEEKHMVILADNISRLDEIVAQEQVFFLKSRGLDQKREATLKEIGLSGKTLKELIEVIDDSNKERFKKIHKDIFDILQVFKEKNNQCQNLVQIRLHRAQAMIRKLDESKANSTVYFKDGNQDEIDVNKMNFISKKYRYR